MRYDTLIDSGYAPVRVDREGRQYIDFTGCRPTLEQAREYQDIVSISDCERFYDRLVGYARLTAAGVVVRRERGEQRAEGRRQRAETEG